MFKFKGISSNDMQVVVEEEEHFIAKAAQRYETTEIEGRDGALFDTSGYSYVERPIFVQCLNINKIDDILAWLNGEGEFEYKGRKTIARFYSELEPKRSACIRIIDATFIRDPFWNKANDEFEIVKDKKDKQASGEYIQLNDSSNMPYIDFKIYGKSEQETREEIPMQETDEEQILTVSDVNVINRLQISGNSWQETREGYNLLCLDFNNITPYGCTYKIDGKKIIATATIASNISLTINFLKKLPADTYTLYTNYKISDATYIGNMNFGNFSVNGGCLTRTATEVIEAIGLNWGNTEIGTEFTFDLSSLMLLKGTYTMENLPSYEEPGAMPSPEFPSKIRNCGDNVNEFDYDTTTTSPGNATKMGDIKNGYWYKGNETETAEFAYSRGWLRIKGFDFKAHTKYYLSFNLKQISKGITDKVRLMLDDISDNKTHSLNIFSINPKNQRYYFELDNIEADTNLMFALNSNEVQITDISISKVKNKYWSAYGCGNVNFKIPNKNWFDESIFNEYKTNENDEAYIFNSNSMRGENLIPGIKFKANTSYTVQYTAKQDTGNPRLTILYTDGTNISIETAVISKDYQTYTQASDPTKTIENIRAEYGGVGTNNFYIKKNSVIMVEGAYTKDNFPEYIPHQEQLFSFPTKKGQVFHKGDYLADDGVHNKRNTLILDSTKTCNIQWLEGIHVFWINISPNIKVNSSILSSHFIGVTNSYMWSHKEDDMSPYMICDAATSNRILIKNQDIDTPEQLKEFLDQQKEIGTPVIIEYDLEEEIIEPYSEEQQEAYNQMKNIEIHNPMTIYSDDEISPYFKLYYNYVPPMPSPEAPSEIKSVANSANLFNKNSIIRDKSFDTSEKIQDNVGTYISDFIPIKGNKSYYISGTKTIGKYNFFYDKDKKLITTFIAFTGIINSPFNAKYLRINGSLNELNIKIQEDSIATPDGKGTVEIINCNRNLGNADLLFEQMKGFDSNNCREKVVDNRNCIVFSNWAYHSGRGFRGLQGRYKENTQYRLKFKARPYDTSVLNNGLFIVFNYTDNTYKSAGWRANGENWIENELISDPNKTIDYISTSYSANIFWCMDKDTFIIEEYVEGQETEYILNEEQDLVIQTEPLRSLPNGVCDVKDKDRTVRRVKRLILDGSTEGKKIVLAIKGEYGWALGLYATDMKLKSSPHTYEAILCTHFKPGDGQQTIENLSDGLIRQANGGNVIWLYRKLSALTSTEAIEAINEFNALLAEQYNNGTPVTIDYELAEPVIEEEPCEELSNIGGYKGVTNITSGGEVKPILDVRYIQLTDELISNTGNIESRPIIRLRKTMFDLVELTINNIRFIYHFNNDDYVDIDCKGKTIQYEGINRNRQIEIGYDFPKLNIGSNKIIMHRGDCIIEIKGKDRWL